MKKLFLYIFSVLVIFAACAKIEDTSVRNNIQNTTEIVFNLDNPFTKAIVEGTTMVDNFGVYGYVQMGDYTTGGYIMKNAEYEEDGTAANGAHYYWPKSDNYNNIDFIFTAYSKYDSNVSFDNTSGEVTITIPTLTQDLITDPSNFDDVLWAQALVDHHQDALDTAKYRVPLTFHHALSWIQFNAEVADNSSIKWVKIDTVKFGEYRAEVPYQPEVPANPGQEYVPEQKDTVDTWINLKRGTNVDGSATKLKGPGESAYTDNAALPAELVNEIKSYYSINNGTAGDYDLHMGNSVWPSSEIRQLRVVKAIPTAYKISAEMPNGDVLEFFDGFKYLKDNGYDIQPRNSGGKPAIWNYILLDAFVNGTAYTVVGLNWGGSSYSNPQYTINTTPEVPYIAPTEYQPEVPYQPAAIVPDGVYVNGSIVLPTRDTINVAPVATYSGDKNLTFNYAPQVDTLYGTSYSGIHETLLSNTLIIPQNTPEYVTLIYDICILNTTGDEIVINDRSITRKINSGKDADNCDYVASWLASNKYIYNFKINVEQTNFTITVDNWDTNTNQYHVWDY